MANRLNMETGDRSRPIEKPGSIHVGADLFTFSGWLPQYIAGQLTGEDWLEAARSLRTHRDAIVGRSVMSGDFFALGGVLRARAAVEKGMNDLIYDRFKRRMVEAGETQWVVPSLLQGERFAI